MSQRPLPTPNANVVMTELDDATGVLLNLDTKIYFTLNATGVFVWKAMVREPQLDLAALAARVVGEFEVDAAQAETLSRQNKLASESKFLV